jgi:hypothetical protein
MHSSNQNLLSARVFVLCATLFAFTGPLSAQPLTATTLAEVNLLDVAPTGVRAAVTTAPLASAPESRRPQPDPDGPPRPEGKPPSPDETTTPVSSYFPTPRASSTPAAVRCDHDGPGKVQLPADPDGYFNGTSAVLSTKDGPPAGLSNPEWLGWWEARHSGWDAWWTWNFNWSPAAADIDGAVTAYQTNTPAGAQQRLEHLMEAVRARYRNDENKVCRHHAILFHRVATRLGFSVEFRCYGVTSSGHSWNRVTIDGHTYVLDAYNTIWYEP